MLVHVDYNPDFVETVGVALIDLESLLKHTRRVLPDTFRLDWPHGRTRRAEILNESFEVLDLGINTLGDY